MKVLVAVDGSAGSSEAVRQIATLLAPGRDQIALFYSPPEVKFPSGSQPTPELAARTREILATAVLDDAVAKLPEGLRGGVHRIVGAPSAKQGILAAADEWHADLIALGARGVGPIAELLLGSVSHHIARHSSVPVYVARASQSSGSPLKIIVACDQQHGGDQLGQVLSSFAWPAGAVGKLLTVIEPMFAGELPEWLETMARDAETEPMAQAWVREHEREKHDAAAALQQQAATLPAPFSASPPIVAEGYPADQILKAAASEKAGLLVLGARRIGVWKRVVIGSTSEKVLSHAPCSVLIVPNH